MARRLDRAIEASLTAGLLASASLLLFGLASGSPGALRLGVVLLMLTPVARVVVLTLGLLLARDWSFGLVSLFVLLVLASGIFVSSHLPSPSRPPVAAPR
jgi:uncharacterized membrane protein